MTGIKARLEAYYKSNETKVDLGFFLGGFLFDVFTLSEVDDLWGILQQVAYLGLAGFILYFEIKQSWLKQEMSPRFQKLWEYAPLVFHFMLGGLLSVYSLFFIKSASFFSSVVFVLLLMSLMVANELKSVQKSQGVVRTSLYVMCLLSFFSLLVPVLMGFVGYIPTFLSLVATIAIVYGVYSLLLKRLSVIDAPLLEGFLKRRLLWPSFSIIGIFFAFYLMGWIPPVPLSVKSMGVYHKIEKIEGQYLVSYETPWWKIWQKGDQDFKAQPGDKIYFFASVFSPATFSDSVVLHWYFKDPAQGWKSTDRIPMKVSGGRINGYRGFSVKQNYSPGDWRVSVETTDGREMGRLYLTVEAVPLDPDRVLKTEVF